MKKIAFLTGSRGEWGYIRPILRLIEEMDDAEYCLIVTNMHLLPDYGSSYKEIEADGFTIHHKIHMYLGGDSHFTQAKSLGICLNSLPDILDMERPDWLVLAGDRGEQLMGAVAAAYTYTPTAHIQAGELSGNIDGMARHAIGKFVHVHFAANEDARQRLIRLGEEGFRVHNVGAPQLDELVANEYTDIAELERKYSIRLQEGFILAVMHPVTEESARSTEAGKAFIEALNQFPMPKIVIAPNNDTGSSGICHAINNFRRGEYHVFSNMKRTDYLGCLRNCTCIAGNSSSGLLEAPTFGVPAVNIGRRQDMRVRGRNVIDVADYNKEDIVNAVRRAIAPAFRAELLQNPDNPYGDGHSSEKILDILMNTQADDRLLVKRLTY